MTTTPPPEPTDDEIRVRIATHCGWFNCYISVGEKPCGNPPSQRNESVWHPHEVPNYLNSLDAMAEAEKTLTAEQRLKYIQELYKTTETDWSKDGCKKLPFATARQRCLAFLSTIDTKKCHCGAELPCFKHER